MNRARAALALAAVATALLSAAAHASADIPGRGTLPDNRGYEVVSPAEKNGADVMASTARTRSSDLGDAVAFASLTPFPGSHGAGVTGEYISQRTGQPGTRGWATNAIIPPVAALNVTGVGRGQETAYQAEFSTDLDKAVLRSYTPLSNDPNVANVSNIYLRPDALTPGNGSYTLLSACPACTAPLEAPLGSYKQYVADTTPDLGHVLFEAGQQLTADASPRPVCVFGCNPNLYEWDHGVLRFVGILPDGSAAPISVAGVGASQSLYTPNTISDDGSKVFFTVPPSRFDVSGDLYMRVDHTTTVQINASERTDCADNDPCTGAPEPDPAGTQPASYQIVSADGSKMFFTSSEQLTDASGSDLYVYDTTLPASDPHNLRHVYTDQQPDDGASGNFQVLGASADGSYLYFANDNAVLPGQPVRPDGIDYDIYVWHDGTINFIGGVDIGAAGFDNATKDWISGGLGSRVTPDGRSVLFTSFTGVGLTGYDHGTTCGFFHDQSCAELYLYRAPTGTLRCVSCNPTGARATSTAVFGVRSGTGISQHSSHLNHPLTLDGEHVFFETGERLLPTQDTNGSKTDVYEYDASSDTLHLITTGQSPDDSHFLDASATGRDVFFATSQPLVGWDADNNYDLYDARVDGGLADPPPGAATECGGDTCQGMSTSSPATAPSGGSAALAGSGNATPSRRAASKSAKRKRAKPASRAARLNAALRACAKKPKSRRKSCETSARKRFHTTSKKGR